jgi:hypothetical protein
VKSSTSQKIGGQITEKTTAPVTASPVSDAEFSDSPGVHRLFSLKRGHLYSLEQEGKIKGVSLRRRGASRGKKLWDVQSIRKYLASQMENGGGK